MTRKQAPTSIGFPRMLKEPGEKRVFLPEFVRTFADHGLTVHVEEGYGSRSGYSFDDYRQANPSVRRSTHEECYQQDLVLVLRSPTPDEFGLLRPGACLISMLHFPTRPRRVQRLREAGVNAISLDSIANDSSLRLVENMEAVAWNGLESAFSVLERRWPNLNKPDGQPIRTLIFGAGMVGKHAVEAATKLGNVERNSQHMQAGGQGALALTIGRSISARPDAVRELFSQTDVLVDATQRRDTAQPVIPNAWLAWLPEHAVITDLAVDPYALDTDPPVVRGVEGIPQGSLDQYIFEPDDPNWDKTVPPSVDSRQRRAVSSCYSWPGIHPEACMRHYAQQLAPLLEPLLEKGYDALAADGSYFERAMHRGSLRAWEQSGHYESRPR